MPIKCYAVSINKENTEAGKQVEGHHFNLGIAWTLPSRKFHKHNSSQIQKVTCI